MKSQSETKLHYVEMSLSLHTRVYPKVSGLSR